jgi:hypothetical protein
MFDFYIFLQVLIGLLIPLLGWFALTDRLTGAAVKRQKRTAASGKSKPVKRHSPTKEPSARDKHRAFLVLCRYAGVLSGGNVTSDEAAAVAAVLGHPLRDHVIACGRVKRVMLGSHQEIMPDWASWLEHAEIAAMSDYSSFIDAVTLHGAELKMSARSIDVQAERVKSMNPIEVRTGDAMIEKRKHVRDAQGRILFMRVIEVDPNGPVALVEYNDRLLARYTITASGLDVQDGWYVPGGRGAVRRRVPKDDEVDGDADPVAVPVPSGRRR